MARPRNVVPTIAIEVTLPAELKTRLDFHLWSDFEQRIPFAAYQKFISTRIREFFATRELDLAPFVGKPPGTYIIRGEPHVINLITELLSQVVT